MTTVRKLLENKPSGTNFSVATTDTVLQAIKVMTDAHIGAVLVTEGSKIVGIYTERDYLYKGEVEGRSAKDTNPISYGCLLSFCRGSGGGCAGDPRGMEDLASTLPQFPGP